MYFTGFADEAGASLDVQIKATKELGWSNIESRAIDGVNIHDISDEKFDEVYDMIKDSGVTINCFGSAVANWAKHPRSDEDFQKSIEELNRAIPRMQKLGTKMLRGMSFAVPKDEKFDSPELEKIIFEKVEHLAKMCEDAGIYYVHENCMVYGGQSHEHLLKLIENVKSDAFKVLFDTGNPPFMWNRIGEESSWVKQDSMEFYKNIKEHIYYIHVKDCKYLSENPDGVFPNADFTYPGEGDGQVKEILTDLVQSGFDGGISIEPHLAAVFHEEDTKDPVAKAKQMYDSYVEYGKRVMQIVEAAK